MQLQKGVYEKDRYLYEPNIPVGNWNEDDWNLRLFNSIKLEFLNSKVRFTTKQGKGFPYLQSELSICHNVIYFKERQT